MVRYSAHLGYLFAEIPLEKRFAAARKAGFTEVEHPNPYVIPAEEVNRLCCENDQRFVQLALPAGNPSRGEKGIACLPGRELDFQLSVDMGITYAKRIGSRFVHVMSGVLPKGVTRDEVWPTYVRNVCFACEMAHAADIPVLIEPIGLATLAGYMMDNPFLALQAIKEVGASNLFMLFDAFHAANAEIDPVAFVRDHHGCIAHVHIADHPGRHEPGSGEINFVALFEALAAANYKGSIGLEYVPAASTEAGLSWRDHFPVAV
ncbi:hydroxypyruvate isomerase [Microvirga sp. KLBC 81]|uniref:hydroxypyruvate isomerase family protein n=1 Tax=Microvirga sp. KLBC 81 TaxID=1862707 RepID=UPI000D51E1F9|nr:TIM barrel protein [Microvirga sp. KLBC 81]PVE24191.1 hydroxypyruvate isomerase [Microvirga sp. KLBC 81]